jgi:hypothetical protein
MARTSAIEKPKAAQPPAQTPSIAELMSQVSPEDRPRLLVELRTKLGQLEVEQARIPERREAARRAAREAGKPEEIERYIAAADDLARRERVLAVQIYQARRGLLEAEIAHLRASIPECEPRVAEAARNVQDAEAAILNAQAALDAATRAQKSLASQLRGMEIEAQEKERELQLLISNQPEI